MDQSLVTSGFDIELLIGDRYVEYILLSLSETGSFPLVVDVDGTSADVFQPTDVDRLYDPHPNATPNTASADSFGAQLIEGHPLGANVRVAIEVLNKNLFVFAYARFGLVPPQGTQQDHRISIEVLAVEATPELQLVLDAKGITQADLLQRVKDQADRDLPLPFVGSGSDVERIEMLQLPSRNGGPAAIGFYMNLRLRNGESVIEFLPARGDPSLGTNFLEDGRDLAFAVRSDLFTDLSAHQKFLFAEPRNDGTGGYEYPIRRDMYDRSSERVGTLYGMRIGPGVGAAGQMTGQIVVEIEGEYFVDNFFDPDFTFHLALTPHFEDGVVTWSHSSDLSSDLAVVLSFVVFGVLGVIGYAIATDVAADRLVDEEQRQQMTNFVQSLPVRVPVEMIRWDPFYLTTHQIVTRVDEWIVNWQGIAFSGRAALGKETEPIDHVVLRTEARDSLFEVERLEYRVNDLAPLPQTLDPLMTFSATDRLDWLQNASEPDLFGLTPGEVVERIAANKINGRQDLVAVKIQKDGNKIFRMLCITPLEVSEQIPVIEEALKAKTRMGITGQRRTDLYEEARTELEAELPTVPTPTQIEQRLRLKVEAIVIEELDAYRLSAQFAVDLENAVSAAARLDMAPNEYGLLQRRGILRVLDYELIERHNRKVRPGTVTLYYRDHPDSDPRDNLLRKPRFRPN